jgi:FtsH-binding integral membrane protein
MQAPQPAPTPNEGMLVLLVLCLWAAMKDRAYKKAGGLRPDKFEKITLAATVGGCVLFILFLFFFLSPEAAGTTTSLLSVVVLGAWEIQRWRVRKKRPAGIGRMLK